jgi:hypothetical protein
MQGIPLLKEESPIKRTYDILGWDEGYTDRRAEIYWSFSQ